MLKKWIFRFFLALMVSECGFSYGQKINLRHYDTSVVRRECLRLVMRHADRGYPFASVVADSAVIDGRRVDVYCSTNLSQRYKIDNVYVLGGAEMSPYYIYNVAGIAPGSFYNESRVTMSGRRLSALGTVEVMQPTEVEFHPDGAADVYMYLKRRRSNAVNAGLALNRSNDDGKYFITGNALADLLNNFGHGESFHFAWNGYDRRSQMLDVRFRWPYAFNTPVTPDFGMEIMRTDTLCLTAKMTAGLGVALSPDVEVKAVADIRRLVSSDNDADNARMSLYGVAVVCRKSSINNTHINMEVSASGGSRKSGDMNGSVADVSSVVDMKIPIGTWARYEGRWTARQMYFTHSPDIHECCPIGGAGSLRGFMTNELRATGLVTSCNTFRVLLADGFSVQAFYDQAFYKCKALQADIHDSPRGMGVGVGMKTGAASMDIGWAIGAEHGKMRPLKDAKTLIIIGLAF